MVYYIKCAKENKKDFDDTNFLCCHDCRYKSTFDERYSYGLAICVPPFASELIATGYQWKAKRRDYLMKQYQEIPKAILEKHGKENVNK